MRRTPLVRRTPLRSTGSVLRRTALRAVSSKRQRENRQRRKIADAMEADGPVLCAWPGEPHYADDLHEIRSRAQGGSITDETNLAALCRHHHTLLTDDPEWRQHAIALGLVITRKEIINGKD